MNEAPQTNWVMDEYYCLIEEEHSELQAGDTETSSLVSGDMDEYRCFIVEEHPLSPPRP